MFDRNKARPWKGITIGVLNPLTEHLWFSGQSIGVLEDSTDRWLGRWQQASDSLDSHEDSIDDSIETGIRQRIDE